MKNNNPLLCNPDTGFCELPADTKNATNNNPLSAGNKPVKIIYFTDPICSSCWGTEPHWRRVEPKLHEKGDDVAEVAILDIQSRDP